MSTNSVLIHWSEHSGRGQINETRWQLNVELFKGKLAANTYISGQGPGNEQKLATERINLEIQVGGRSRHARPLCIPAECNCLPIYIKIGGRRGDMPPPHVFQHCQINPRRPNALTKFIILEGIYWNSSRHFSCPNWM